MTEEDEEFNRIERESQIKQNYVRDIKAPSREALLAEVAVLTEMVRVLSDKLAQMEAKQEQGEPDDEEVLGFNGWGFPIKPPPKQAQGEPYGYVVAKGGGIFIYGEHQFQNTKNAELVPVYLHPKQEQSEPVAYVTGTYAGRFVIAPLNPAMVLPVNMALYTAPQQRTWVGLKSEDYNEIFEKARTGEHAVQLAEAKLKEKNT
jgi:hypothetical protein